MARVRINLDEGPLLRLVDHVRDRTNNLRPLMERWKAVAVAAIDRRFIREGPGWPKHSPATEKRRGIGAPILRDDRTLSRSIVGENSDGLVEVGENFVELGTTVKYARIHNFGGEILVKSRKSKNPDYRRRKGAKDEWTVKMPQRRFLPNEEELMPALVAEAEDYLEEVIESARSD